MAELLITIFVLFVIAAPFIMIIGTIMCLIESIKSNTITDKFIEDLKSEQRKDK